MGPRIPTHLLARNAVEEESAAAEVRLRPEAGPSVVGPVIPPAVIIVGPTVPVPRYEEEEDSEDEDVYAPELPPDLAAARANSTTSSVPPAARRPIGPARGGPSSLQREEEEEESDDEIGPAPPPGAGPASSSHVHEDAVIDFMQKEAQRRQAIEVRVFFFRFAPSGFPRSRAPCAPRAFL